jgi:YHS domain-containing protein
MNSIVCGIYINRIMSTFEMMPIDPVCGIEMDQELAIMHNHKNKTYYFCCDGCKRIFTKKPHKYSK